MKWLLSLMLCVLSCGALVQSANHDAIRSEKAYNEKLRQVSKVLTETVGISGYDCELNANEPENIHNLSPEFVDVVAALGDSVTAGYGGLTDKYTELTTQFRGISWTIGGDGSLEHVATLPNMLRVFNSGLKGASRLVGGLEHPNAKLNVAFGGAQSIDMLGQAEELVEKMDNLGVTAADWKVISLWIGGNDLCEIKDDQKTPEEIAQGYVQNVKAALDHLHENVHRAFINVILVVDITGMTSFNGPLCNFIQWLFCKPLKDGNVEKMAETYRLYNAGLHKLISGGTYYDREDFTVVLQPFFSETKFATLEDEINPDMSYIALDCFHLSQKGHAVAARYLWNNMFQPVGAKTRSINWDMLEPLKCPIAYPYFATYQNSLNRGEGVKKEEL